MDSMKHPLGLVRVGSLFALASLCTIEAHNRRHGGRGFIGADAGRVSAAQRVNGSATKGVHLGDSKSLTTPQPEPELPVPGPNLPEVLRYLRVCNAYQSPDYLEVFVAGSVLIDGSIPYGQCREQVTAIRVGQRIEFQVGLIERASFVTAGIPSDTSLLLLVVYKGRKPALNPANRDLDLIRFKSHFFGPATKEPVIAVIDAYNDGTHGRHSTHPKRLTIRDDRKSKMLRSEQIMYDSFVAVNPGQYEVILDPDEEERKEQFVAKEGGRYCIIRIGKSESTEYRESVLVWPEERAPAKNNLLGGTSRPGVQKWTALLVVCTVITLLQL